MAKTLSIQIAHDNSAAVMAAITAGAKIAFEEIGQSAERYAKEICPVDTGRLRNSISHAVDDRSVSVGTNVEYAPYVELGARGRTPQPFIRPSIEDNLSSYQSVLVKHIKDAMG